MDNSKYIIGIESSCDETAAAIVRNGRELVAASLATSIAVQREFGGVVPELASRAQLELILPVIEECLEKAQLQAEDIAAIAVTQGPGLIGSLLVGLTAAKALAFAWSKPLIGIHHLAGHVAANYLKYPDLEPPFLALIVSGGHSHLVLVHDYTDYELLAASRDDAVGEVYDKLARELGLAYPGGPVLDRLAAQGEARFNLPEASFTDSYDFSFSGLKTACLELYQKELRQKGSVQAVSDEFKADLAASFQSTVVSTLIERTAEVLEAYQLKKLVLAGGVAANQGLRKAAQERFSERYELYIPPLQFCTDNAAMIAAQAYYHYLEADFKELSLNAQNRLDLPRKKASSGCEA
ncbi:MAG: tRNA (adenosine(37)-N6)-threonylcarbamoyltransferase complex transferase subunit TsaD [Eubacteriales bacterium]|nr:tRNA (adenosine(37)-N6)-threonylcarbamoyltransferase complex transferase subunit TsaD [Eubacteriales bacterium]